MHEYSSLTRPDLNAGLAKQDVLVAQIINVGIVMGVGIFFAVIIFLHYSNYSDSDNGYTTDPDFINIFAMVVIVLAFAEYGICYLLAAFWLSPERLKKKLSGPVHYHKGVDKNDPVDKMMVVYREVMVIRLALMQSVALIGLVPLLMAVMGGYTEEAPLIWLFTTPMVILIFYVYLNFPTKDKVVDFIEQNILAKIRG